MATYRKQLKDKNGDDILPVTGYIGDVSLSEVDTGYDYEGAGHIYKRTFVFFFASPSGNPTISVSSLNIGTVVKMEGVMHWGGNNVNSSPIPYYANSGDFCRAYIYNNTLYLSHSGRVDYNESWAEVTIYYTKTS